MTFSLSVPLTPCQVPVEMQADPGVTSVCWARREASEKRKQTLRRPNLEPLDSVASQRRQQLREEKKKKGKKRQCSTSQGDIKFETWVFCFHMNSQAPSDRWGIEISHYERQISLLFWFRSDVPDFWDQFKMEPHTLKNSSSVGLVEGKCVSLSIAEICALPIATQNCVQTVIILARCLYMAPTSFLFFLSLSLTRFPTNTHTHTNTHSHTLTEWCMHVSSIRLLSPITYASTLPTSHISNLPWLATTNITFTYWFRSFSQCKYAVITVNLSFC